MNVIILFFSCTTLKKIHFFKDKCTLFSKTRTQPGHQKRLSHPSYPVQHAGLFEIFRRISNVLKNVKKKIKQDPVEQLSLKKDHKSRLSCHFFQGFFLGMSIVISSSSRQPSSSDCVKKSKICLRLKSSIFSASFSPGRIKKTYAPFSRGIKTKSSVSFCSIRIK